MRGRRRFIWAFVIARLTLPLTLLATALRAATEPFRWGHFLLHLVVNVVVAGIVGGYIAGAMLWELIVARTTEPGDGRRPPRADRGRGRRAAGR